MESETPGQNIERWDYSTHFREYLLLLASKRELGLESIKNFPKSIELSSGWHRMFDRLRKKSASGKECWGFIGFKDDMRSLWFPVTPAVGYDSYIPGKLIKKTVQKARDKFGIVNLIGDAHTHPRDFLTKASQLLPSLNTHGLKGVFSAGDLYSIVDTEYFRPFMSLVDGNYNLFVFRTRETKGLGVRGEIFNQESFERYWYEKYGYRYLGSAEKFGANRAIPIMPNANPYRINVDIAKRYNLAIYQGRKDRDIKRVFPK